MNDVLDLCALSLIKKMKLKSIIVSVFCFCSITACDTLKQIGSSLLVPSQYEMAMGLRQALEQGLFKSFDAFSNPQNNNAIAFVFPNDAQKIINIATQAGFGSVVTQTTDKFNRAIAQSFIASKSIFVDAVKSMSFKDVVGILITNNQQAATDYFKTTTYTQLMNAYTPIIDSTITLEGANKEWKKIANIVNNIPFSNFKVETSLTQYVAARAVDELYKMVAAEEAKIRTDLSFRKTDLVKRVFGYADEELKKKNP